MKRLTTCIALAFGLGGCGGPDFRGSDDVLASSSSSLTTDNGRSLNGRSLNGRSLNGRSLSGAFLVGVKNTGVQLAGAPVTGLSLSATVFSGTVNGATKTGKQLVGSTWTGMVSDGSTVQVRVDTVAPLPSPNGDLLGYGISYQASTGWSPVCGFEPDGSEALAIPMPGLWNYGGSLLSLGIALSTSNGSYDPNAAGYTFACRHYAIAKCLEMGYRSWTTKNGESLQPYTVSCTRALRADYCGTGDSYTIDGTVIDVYDRAGIQAVTQPSWPIEAEWNPNGARCMAPASKDRFTNTNQILPPCYLLLVLTGCGETFRPGTYFVDRFQRAP
jgi:ADYC domain